MSRVLVMASGPDVPTRCGADTVVVSTPLDLIRMLEDRQTCVASVVLVGKFAHDHQLASFITETYPTVEVVIEGERIIEALRENGATLVA